MKNNEAVNQWRGPAKQRARWVTRWISGLMASAAWLLAAPDDALAACAGGAEGPSFNVTRSFASGASWSFDISKAPCEGLAISNVRYTAFGGTQMTVLARATLAEVHVPYDNNAARFLDVTTDTSGLGDNAITLSGSECSGTLQLSNQACVENEDGDYRWKYHGSFATMHAVVVSMASQLGEYTYINRWVFREDGTIEPMVGLTGNLQLYSNTASDAPQFGSNVGLAPPQQPVIGLNHMHNFYYRLDFDINGAGNDVVSRVSYAPFNDTGACAGTACGKTTFTPITTEQAQTWNSANQVTWLIQDKGTLNNQGRRVGYEVKPHYTGTWRGKTDGSEAWAQHDVFVTRYNSCERFAARNTSALTGCSSPAPAANVFTMVNGEATDGQDVVVWFVNRHHHVTRDEDEAPMPIEWTGFEISPRQFYDSNPAP